MKTPNEKHNDRGEYQSVESLMAELDQKFDEVARLTRTIMFGWATNIAVRHWTFYYMQTSEKKFVKYLLRTRCGKYGASCQWYSNNKSPVATLDGTGPRYVSKMVSPARGSMTIPISRFSRATHDEKEQILKAEAEIEKLRSASAHLTGMSNKYLSFLQRIRTSETLSDPDLVINIDAPELNRYDPTPDTETESPDPDA